MSYLEMNLPENENTETPETDAAAEGPRGEGEQSEEPKFGRRKIVILLLILMLIIAGGISTFMFLKAQKAKEEAVTLAEKENQVALPQAVFVDMDEIIVNLNTDGKAVSFMKIKITLEVASQSDEAIINKLMPRVRDVFQVYMRELRPSDMQGSVGLYRLKEELLYRINKLVYPAKVNDLLFKDVLIQ
jgi:flagellar FliL protein